MRHRGGPSGTRTRRATALVAGSAAALLLAACGGGADPAGTRETGPDNRAPSATRTPPQASAPATAPVRHRPLRAGEHRITVRMAAEYTPRAPTGAGTDDYHCSLLDPGVTSDQMITGFNVLPGNADVVHHVILFRVPAEHVAEAEQLDAATPGQGWTCFGTSGMGSAAGAEIDDAPWLGAWAPGGREQLYGKGLGEELGAGSRVIMQVHYNLLGGSGPDRTAAELRVAPSSDRITALQTQLLPAPVELPCRPGHEDGSLCGRSAALADVKKRFGAGPGSVADVLHLLCSGGRAGPVQTCTRPVTVPETVRGVAGHMHLLGRSIRVDVNPGTPRARTLLDISTWDFDDQRSRALAPVHLVPGDMLRVRCRHSQELRDDLPAFAGQPEKYVLWGEGTTDEMCLGILLVTRP